MAQQLWLAKHRHPPLRFQNTGVVLSLSGTPILQQQPTRWWRSRSNKGQSCHAHNYKKRIKICQCVTIEVLSFHEHLDDEQCVHYDYYVIQCHLLVRKPMDKRVEEHHADDYFHIPNEPFSPTPGDWSHPRLVLLDTSLLLNRILALSGKPKPKLIQQDRL